MTNSIYSVHDSHQIKKTVRKTFKKKKKNIPEKKLLHPVHQLNWNFICATKRYTLFLKSGPKP